MSEAQRPRGGQAENGYVVARSDPSIWLGCADSIRFSTRATSLGWMNWTVSWPATSKLW